MVTSERALLYAQLDARRPTRRMSNIIIGAAIVSFGNGYGGVLECAAAIPSFVYT